jgi:hypothetical protein
VNVYVRLWLTCMLLSASCCCRLSWLQISGVSLTLTYLLRLCLLRVLLGTITIVTSFPLSKHTGGGGDTHTFPSRYVYLQYTWEVILPPSPVEFSSQCKFYKLPRIWLLGRCCHSCLLWLACLFTVTSDCPFFHLQRSGHLALFATCLFVVVVYYSVWGFILCFPWVGVSLSRRLCWSGPGLAVGAVPHAA